MKTILVPVDFSKCSANAFKFALEVASRTHSEIVALHVIFPNEGVDNNVYNAFWIDEYFKQREKDLENWVGRQQRAATFKNVNCRAQCTIGFPVQSIHTAAEKDRAALIVMGTTGATGLRKVLLGSVAAGVIAKTKKPVIVVPQKAKYRDKANIVFATDFRLRTGLDILRELPQVKGGKLHVVHILDKPGAPDKSQEKGLSQKLEGVKHDFHYLHDLETVQAVSNFMESTDAHMLVAVAHEHSLFHRLFFDSTTRKLAQQISVPMLVLHDA